MRFWKFEILEKCPGPIFQKPAKNGFLKMPPFSGSKIPLLAIHKIISHIWEDAPRKVNNDEPDLRFFHGNFWPVISRTVRKPCFSTSIPRGPNLCILDFQTPPAPDEFSNPDPGPSQRTQGWNTSARETLAVDNTPPRWMNWAHQVAQRTRGLEIPNKFKLNISRIKIRSAQELDYE